MTAPSRPLFSLLLIAGVLATPLAGRTQAPGEKWTPELMLQIRRVSSVRPSPNGKRAVYVVTRPLISTERSENLSRIFLVNADGTGTRPLTREETSATDPQWMPDGSAFSFVYARQIHLIRADGSPGERLTEAPGGVGTYAWSPDGTRIAYTMIDPMPEARLKAIREKDDAYFFEEDVPRNRLYVISLAKDAEGKRPATLLTPQPFNVGPQFDWSPDGKSIVFAHTPTPKADDMWSADVSVVDLETKAVRPLAATPAIESEPQFSPDGKSIAIVTSGELPRYAQRSRLQILPAAGGAPRTLPDTPDSRPTLLDWSADGKELYFTENEGTLNRLRAITVDGGMVRTLNTGSEYHSGFTLDPTRHWFGCVTEKPDQSPEAAMTPAEAFAPKAVSQVNADLPRPPLGKTEVVRWKSDGDWEVEGLLTYPVGYQPGTKVPLLVQIHGGPAGAFGQQFLGRSGIYPNAAFASAGFALLQPNPRGSTGYGSKFQDQNYKDWGGSDYRDVMAGVDHVIKLGVADPNRLGIMGWSYGGYLTGWTLTQTDRFKVASLGAGVSNLVSQTGTTDIATQRLGYFGAWPWDDPKLYLERSPLLHAAKVKTPTMIQHGEVDRRVPITQSFELYTALKKRGVPVRMLILPRQAHGPSEPKMVLKVMQTNLDWFQQHLMPK